MGVPASPLRSIRRGRNCHVLLLGTRQLEDGYVRTFKRLPCGSLRQLCGSSSLRGEFLWIEVAFGILPMVQGRQIAFCGGVRPRGFLFTMFSRLMRARSSGLLSAPGTTLILEDLGDHVADPVGGSAVGAICAGSRQFAALVHVGCGRDLAASTDCLGLLRRDWGGFRPRF
jgi:hypothetical protein